MSIKTYAQAIKDVLAEEMRREEKVFVMGEDVAKQALLRVAHKMPIRCRFIKRRHSL